MPGLVEQGIVHRRDVPPAALFRLAPHHIAARALLAVTHARTIVLQELGSTAAQLSPPPLSVIVFGSLAQGTARAGSDIDIVVIRPDTVDDDDQRWHADLEAWRQQARHLTGNAVEVVEVGAADAARLLRSRRPLWADIRQHGVVVHGQSLDQLQGQRSA
jgi:predicted nucleotidyltransferase